jgi:tetratricopeptide (TPR) repeat protein
MEKKKAKNPVRGPRNLGGNTGEGQVENVKILRKAKADFNAAKSKEDFMKIIKTLQETSKSDHPDTSALIGSCYMKCGEYGRAVHSFADAADKDEKEPEHHNNCGKCYQNLKEYDEALFHYSKAIELGKTNGEYYYNRAIVKKEINEFKDAIKDFEQAIKFIENKQSSEMNLQKQLYKAYYFKGICLRELERFDESIQDLK